jgi:hypothetical protein
VRFGHRRNQKSLTVGRNWYYKYKIYVKHKRQFIEIGESMSCGF